jgi:hypothetical protein
LVNMKKYPYLIGVFLLILTACGVRATPTPETEGANSVVISTFTAAPTDASISPEALTPILASTPNSHVIGKLPGLSPVNVTVNLEGQKFTCTQVKKGAVYYERTCIKGVPSVNLLQVVISGREPFVVDFIEASVLQYTDPDNKIATELLSFMATMPYDGATPEDARKWVERTIPTLSGKPDDTQEMVFGGVKYVLYGPPTALTLEMGELP